MRLCRRNPPPHSLFASVKKRTGRGRSKRKNAFDERAAHPGRPFVSAGVVRIGPAGVDGPVDLALSLGGRRAWSPHNAPGRATGRETNGPAPLSAAAHLAFDERRAVRCGGMYGARPAGAGDAQLAAQFAVGADFHIRLPLRLFTGTGPAAAQFQAWSRFRCSP